MYLGARHNAICLSLSGRTPMSIQLELEPEVEQRLRDIAALKGLSAEGYLLTLVESLVKPKEEGRKGILFLPRKWQCEPDPRRLADEALREMRANLFHYKERAVEAATRMNLLQRTVQQQEQRVLEKELQALESLRVDDQEQALHCFQEKTVFEENLAYTCEQLRIASEIAEEAVSIFKAEETRMQTRASQAQSAALEAIKSEFAKETLSQEQMEKRITQTSLEEWQQKFEQWIQSHTAAAYRQMAANEARESEATEWAEATVEDASDAAPQD